MRIDETPAGSTSSAGLGRPDFVKWLVHAQHRRPGTMISIALLSLVPALLLALRLEVRTDFRDLLPEDKESVVELDRLNARIGGRETLTVVVEGGDADVHREFVDALSPKLRKMGPNWVVGVDDGMRSLRHFVRTHWWLYLSPEALHRLRSDLKAAKDDAVAKRAGWDLGLDDDGGSPPMSTSSLREHLNAGRLSPWGVSLPDYYLGDDGRFGVIVVRTPLTTADARAPELRHRVQSLARRVAHDIGQPGLAVRFTGSLVTSDEEHDMVVRDLAHVGVAGVLLVLGVVLLFFLRVRVLLAMAATIGVGCVWTFALGSLLIGHLNSATGFLTSIVAGNGINFGIVYTARYLEARHEEELPVEGAVARATHGTWQGTLTAACCAAIAYGSLAVTSFPAFRQFGVIGGLGMLCCWVATFLVLPCILVLSERLVPVRVQRGDWRRRTQWFFAGPLYAVASRAPRAVTILGSLVVAGGVAAGAYYVMHDPTEYDLTAIRNDASPGSARALGRRVATVVGALSRDGRALAVDRLDQVEPLVEELKRRRDAAPPGAKPFGRVVSILDLVPLDQHERIALAREVVQLIREARTRDAVDDDLWAEVSPLLPREVGPVRVEDVPSGVAWLFDESDGTRGRLVYLVPTPGSSLNDARYLLRWADSFRRIDLPDGSVVHGSGPPVIFADVLNSTRAQAPRAVLASFGGTLLFILLAFRLRRAGWFALASVTAGAALLLGVFWATGVRINFLNFMALPITIGVGADYAVNVMRRLDLESGGDPERAFVRTGGAVVLCSLTTMLGYGALLTSLNGAVRSFGFAAAVGEVTMILCAVFLLPAWLCLRRPPSPSI